MRVSFVADQAGTSEEDEVLVAGVSSGDQYLIFQRETSLPSANLLIQPKHSIRACLWALLWRERLFTNSSRSL
jgi:hypothetical protein